MTTTAHTRWVVFIGENPAPIISTPPISTYEEARLFALDISGSIGPTGVTSVRGFSSPRSDKAATGDILIQFRDGKELA